MGSCVRMTALLLDGKLVAATIREEIKQTVSKQVQQGHRCPGLAVILLGDNTASSIYVASKRKACTEVGFHSSAYDLPTTTSEEDLIALIEQLNNDEAIDGILVQLPLPPHINSSKIIECIKPTKDVDGFHPYNLGRLAQGNPELRPCTPYGVIQLLNYYHYPFKGKNAVVVGASNIVGRPMALEFLNAKATVTVCHRKTNDLEQHVRKADIIVVATGSYNSVKPEWLSEKQTVIDVGMHRKDDGTVHGDVNFHEAVKRVQSITPVPGGIGPMTICTLLKNTLQAALIHSKN